MSKNEAGLAALIVLAVALFAAIELAHAADGPGYRASYSTMRRAPAVDTIDALAGQNGVAPPPGSDLVCGAECAAAE
jgi:hypothetical protein